MLPVSEERGVSWLPATRTIGAPGQRVPQPLELPEGEDDRGVGGRTEWNRSPAMTTASGRCRDDVVDHAPEGVGDVGFPLVDARGGLAVVLAESEVGIREVGEFHE